MSLEFKKKKVLSQTNGTNGKLSPQEKERLSLEVAAMFGDKAAAEKLNAMDSATKAQASQIQPPPSAEIEETFKTEPLDVCSECGQLLPAYERLRPHLPGVPSSPQGDPVRA